MNVSIREKEDCAISALNILVAALVKEYGYTPTFWLNYIYSSYFIKDLMNMEKDVNIRNLCANSELLKVNYSKKANEIRLNIN